MVARDPARAGQCQAGHFRAGVYKTSPLGKWDTLIQKFEANMGNCDVTYRHLQLAERDSTTGWRKKKYVESTIKMAIVTRGSTSTALPPGSYVRSDALGFVGEGVEVGSQIFDEGIRYEIEAVREHKAGNEFWYREVDLTIV